MPFFGELPSLAVSDNIDVLCLCLDVTFEKSPFIDSADVACLSFREAYILICVSLKCFTLISIRDKLFLETALAVMMIDNDKACYQFSQ